MKRLAGVIAAAAIATSCGTQPVAPVQAPPAAATPRMNMLQLMRAFPFPHSNVLFDTQGTDPEGPEKTQSMSFSVYRWQTADTYAGWPGVEASALALAEMAPLLMTPRACANGKTAPVDHPKWKAGVEQTVAAGLAAHKAALTKNMEAMLEVSEQITNACASCHDVFRDVDLEGGERCVVPSTTAE